MKYTKNSKNTHTGETTMKNTLKRFYLKMLAGRQETADFRIAHMVRHDYPENTSLHQIVADLRKKRKQPLTDK